MEPDLFTTLDNLTSQSLASYLWLSLEGVLRLSFIWLPILLVTGTWRLWINYKQAQFIYSQKSILLEIKLPAITTKTPQAMELVLTALYQTGGEGTWIDRWVKGKTRPWFSLELVSIGGQVKFFIWTRPMWKNLIEAQIYAQYPGVEVHEVEDYARDVKYDKEKLVLWGCEFALTKPDPYPIRTYLDYPILTNFPGALETEKVDPISSTIEYLGSLNAGEQAWIQIIVRAHKADRPSSDRVWYNPITWFAKTDWKQDFKAEVDKILAKDKEGKKLTKGDNDTIDALQRSVAKFPFETGIRALYIAKKENFSPVSIPGLTGSFRQYNSNNLNGFKPTRGLTVFSYPWQDWNDIRQERTKWRLLDAYKFRSYFHAPYKQRHFILNTEELATIFHFPGAVVSTPSLSRVSSKKGEPPPDLPI